MQLGEEDLLLPRHLLVGLNQKLLQNAHLLKKYQPQENQWLCLKLKHKLLGRMARRMLQENHLYVVNSHSTGCFYIFSLQVASKLKQSGSGRMDQDVLDKLEILVGNAK